MENKKLTIGDKVLWTDPDNDISTGIYTIKNILLPEGEEPDEDTIYFITNESGTEAEVLHDELKGL